MATAADAAGSCDQPHAPARRERRTKDGSVYVFDTSQNAWRLDSAPPPVVADATADGPLELQALPWAQFDVNFDGSFLIDGKSLRLGPGRGLRSQEEQQHADTGRTIWDGSIALAKALESCRWLVEGQQVIEVGSGRGVVSLAAGLLGAKRVVATDLSYALEDLQQDVVLNGLDEGRFEVAALDWSQTAAFLDSRPADEHFDVVLAADVTWLLELVDPLVSALRAICERYSRAEVAIVHQLRATNVEEAFLAGMADAGFEIAQDLQGTDASRQKDFVGGEERALSWHPDFTPDGRMRLWLFRLKEAVRDVDV